MQNHNNRGPGVRTAAIIVSLLLGLPSVASAAQVQSSLTPAQTGISVKQLLSSKLTTNVALPTGGAKPTGMGNVVAGIHLGTNTDVFAVGTTSGIGGTTINASEFWVRYTLDATSSASWTNTSYPDDGATTTPLSGSLWLSFNLATQTFGVNDSQMSGNLFYDNATYSTYYRGAAPLNVLYSSSSGDPNYTSPYGSNADLFGLTSLCLECSYRVQLNLSFVDLRWTGTKFDLFTNSQGFDQIFNKDEACWMCGWTASSALNIAPVPVPPAAWIFGSGLVGLAISRRRVAII